MEKKSPILKKPNQKSEFVFKTNKFFTSVKKKKKKKNSHQFCKINLHATLLSLSLSTFPLSDSATIGLYNSGNL